MALPLESLIEDYSYSAGSIPGTDFTRSENTTFSCNIVLPSSPTQEGILFEIGGAGTGTWVGLRDSGATFRIRAGDGATSLSASSSDCALLDIDTASSSYFDGNSHDVAWEIRINPGSVRLWIDGDLVGESYTSGYGALDNSNFGGGDDGGYGQGNTGLPAGEPTTSWPYTLNSNLSVYSGQGVLTDGFRITETSDSRIDESGNVRVSEGLVEAFTSLSGAGTASFIPSKNTPVSANVSGTGSVVVDPDVNRNGLVSLSGSGSVVVNPDVNSKGSASFSGSGSVFVDPDVNRNGFVSLSGSGSIASSGDISIRVSLVAGGSSSVTADPDLNAAGVVNISGTGSVATAQSVTIRSAKASLESVGSKITEASFFGNAVVSLSATGSASITGIRIKNAATSLSASGTVTFLGLNTFDISKSLSGTGVANFNGIRAKNASTSLTGAGTFNNDGFSFVHYGSHLGEELTYTRVTEAGDTRVDEDNNVRIVIQAPNLGEGVLYATFDYIKFSSTAYIKYNGEWTQFTPKVKQDGTWADPLAIYKKIDEQENWKRAY